MLGGCASHVPPAPPPAPEPLPATAAPAPEPIREAAPPPSPAPRRPEPIKIDNSTIEAFRVSWERLRASLSPQQQLKLNDAVARLTFARYSGAPNLPGNLRNSPIVPEMIRDRIAGLTYVEIIALTP
jgi:hypothetical protein